MVEIGQIAAKVRSKNAGPFWLTIDIFCRNRVDFERISTGLETDRIAARFRADPALIKRFDIAELNVVKLSLPRPAVQGTRPDRDMHGAAWAVLVEEMEVD
ncbi:DUF4387 domain-containing protein [Defluviimonas sp. WL0024]|uniref:DUF4387 domain-containing protein n=2 Tax=Albidovulum TaxID=205889 RepID=A0ABT3J1D3_9RHOB|nr:MULTISPECIES: DUF4387 domain-containing protein [Defluviimonas]MCU9848074.1 DUF4387 domain-containing protein [Defluviimonas sp. WL0024]MCW3781496.1 DUF4387 domain-containing protein [Defluviimonas salinarum]